MSSVATDRTPLNGFVVRGFLAAGLVWPAQVYAVPMLAHFWHVLLFSPSSFGGIRDASQTGHGGKKILTLGPAMRPLLTLPSSPSQRR